MEDLSSDECVLLSAQKEDVLLQRQLIMPAGLASFRPLRISPSFSAFHSVSAQTLLAGVDAIATIAAMGQ
jgi:hypothetical protein